MRRPYHRPMPNTWWLKRWPYTRFMLREISSVVVAVYLVVLLLLIQTVRHGDAADYDGLMTARQSPVWVLFHVVALAAALFHTVTWFNAVPQAMRVFRGEERVPPPLVAGPNYVLWIIVSVVVLFLFDVV